MTAGSGGGRGTVVVTVHGPVGVLDLVVPTAAEVSDVAREYAEQASLATVPMLHTARGASLRPDLTVQEAGLGAGDVLVATTSREPAAGLPAPRPETPVDRGTPWSTAWLWVAAVVALSAGWSAAQAGPGTARAVTTGLLVAATAVAVLPVGAAAPQRALVAPAFAGAAAFATVWEPGPERLPLVIGIAALAAATVAGIGRMLLAGPDEGLRVWMVAGGGGFAVSLLAALLGSSPAVVWSVVVVGSVLAARFVPAYAVDVPDHQLIDLERLAVTAWSARDSVPGRRGRAVVPPEAVAGVAARATRTMTAAAAAVALAAPLGSLALLTRPDPTFDRVGARCLVLFAGAALVLTARHHRHAAVRTLLRVAGLGSWAVLAARLLPDLAEPLALALFGVTTGLGLLLVVVAVATGRGWRSIRWSRRAEVAEGFAVAAAIASVVAATGVLRVLWETVP